MGDDQAVVLLDGVSYSLTEIPSSTSKVVKFEKARLLGSIDLEALVDDLGRLGNCVRIAYHGVAGYTELQIKVQRIGYDVTKLCDRSAITISQFKKASGTVLLSLQSTYQYLLDGLENMAVYTLADVAETAEGMSTAAKKLCTEFNEQAEHVIETVEEIARTQGMEEKRKEKMEKERKDMEAKCAMYSARDKAAQEHERKAELLYQAAQCREDEAVKAQTGVITSIINAVSTKFLGGPAIPLDAHKDKAASAREEKLKQLEIMQEQQEHRRIALEQLAEFSERIQNSKVGETQVEAAIESLYKAHGALKSLAAVMMKAALFWEQMQNHCKELANGKIKKEIEIVRKMPKEERLEVWTSRAFKLKAIHYCAGWVALDDVCSVYVERIKLTQQELYTYIQESLRPDAARKKVKELAIAFQKDLYQQQRAIADKKFQQQMEIDNLNEEAKACTNQA